MKTVLITGASRGIGFAAAGVFLQNGFQVILTGRKEDSLRSAVRELNNPHAAYQVWDIADTASDDARISEATALFGEIEVFVNNAGVVDHEQLDGTYFPNVSEEAWDRTMCVNFKGTFFACQAEARYLIDRKKGGHIVNVCSEMAYHASSDPYGISKWGVRAFTPKMAAQLAGYGIVMNGIAPGETSTGIIRRQEGEVYALESPRGRCAVPREIAEEIYFLATRDNIIGSILLSDGGRSIY